MGSALRADTMAGSERYRFADSQLTLSVLNSMEIVDTSRTNAALDALQRRVALIAEKELGKIAARADRYARQSKPVPA